MFITAILATFNVENLQINPPFYTLKIAQIWARF